MCARHGAVSLGDVPQFLPFEYAPSSHLLRCVEKNLKGDHPGEVGLSCTRVEGLHPGRRRLHAGDDVKRRR